MKRVIIRIGAVAAFLLSGSALGQQAPAATETKPAKPQLAAQVHTEIRVFLANGDKITGIVKNNRFCEKPNGKDFVAATPDEKGSGLRLFFIHDTKSYVFFPKEKYTKYERVRGLTEVEFRDLARSVEDVLNKKDAAEDPSKKEADPKAKGDKAAEKKPTPEEQEALAKKQAQEAEWRALLDRFSPEAGWGEERLQKIQRNKTNGVYPSPEEAEFEKQYSAWRKAFDWSEEERMKREEEEKKAKKSAVPGS